MARLDAPPAVGRVVPAERDGLVALRGADAAGGRRRGDRDRPGGNREKRVSTNQERRNL